ncbi:MULTISPECIES: helix-turn-helix domain-containing protein [unclassified Enterococcus]|uniref:helix-turn-helix domain-containing protein n=1 Tax=unclassified Enterococcus TaxID=2608891 RepID=UPI0015563E68|nr:MULTISPECIES: helix-turn-helix domain-containing protein [unclassified Enterococcus]MBS7576941.1 helix-turn-helix domain-containing protein [Enterococcus sp. MMGLQ5-2]MBS7584348.1 helix-turn-helix domain-containing protein [Enterococcus sp. MMGLQ5-1]NPD12203.1 M protein trans-acting positive regulator [Enterococcus sp. MMGLQ5-1]NPD36775.1 M protein trans-acting positive regulator [Enterococcus sp. MMGLQ5-2]
MIPNYLKRELLVLFFIINKKDTSLNEVSEEFGISKRLAKSTLLTINDHFVDYLALENFFVSTNHGSIYVNDAFKNSAVNYAYLLKLSLLQTNICFNYCIILITNYKIQKDDLLDQLFISDIYLAKLTAQLNRYFKSFKFKIVISEGYYSLKGDEVNIRLFSYLYLQDSFQDLEWPFTTISLDEIKEEIPKEILKADEKKSNTKKRSLYILYAILKIRINGDFFIILHESKDFQDLLNLIKNNFDIALIFKRNIFKIASEEKILTEILYFNFLARIFIADVVPTKQKIAMGKIFSQSANPYCTLSVKIINQIQYSKLGNLPLHHRYLCIYFLTIFNTFYGLVNTSYDTLTDLFIPNITYYLTIKNKMMDAIKTGVTSIIHDKKQAHLVSSLLYSLYRSEIKTSLKIYLQMTKDFTADYFITNRLQNLFNAKNIQITTDYISADLIITDTLERSEKGTLIFFLNDVNNEQSWDELLVLVQNLYKEKLAEIYSF